jgi:hypothetical protein
MAGYTVLFLRAAVPALKTTVTNTGIV